jgi:hypothetical protein
MAGRPIALWDSTSRLDLGAPPAPLVIRRVGAQVRGAARSARSLPRPATECLRRACRRGRPLELPAQPERHCPGVAELTVAIGDMDQIVSQATRHDRAWDGAAATVPGLATATPPVGSGASMSAGRAVGGLPACPPRHAPRPSRLRPPEFPPERLRPTRPPKGRGSVPHA